MSRNSSRTTKEVWDNVRIDYFAGQFKTLAELAAKFNVSESTLNHKVNHQKWGEQREMMQRSLLQKVGDLKEDVVQSYLKRTFKRAEVYERIIDASRDNLGSKDANGTPLLDPDAINTYTLSEIRIHELAKSALRIPDSVKPVDITSKGQSIGESLVAAIARLREDTTAPRLTEQDLNRILEAEVIEDDVSGT